MSKVVIFDPALCCSAGACGTSADPELLRVATEIENLKKAGIDVERYNLSSDPKAFMQCKAVSDVLYQQGEEALPITVLDGKIVKSGSYLTNEEFADLFGVPAHEVQPVTKIKVNNCGCSSKSCCK